jgi:hypothetical protein
MAKARTCSDRWPEAGFDPRFGPAGVFERQGSAEAILSTWAMLLREVQGSQTAGGRNGRIRGDDTNLRAICPTCETLMHRRTSVSQLETIRAFLDLTLVERSPRLRDTD